MGETEPRRLEQGRGKPNWRIILIICEIVTDRSRGRVRRVGPWIDQCWDNVSDAGSTLILRWELVMVFDGETSQIERRASMLRWKDGPGVPPWYRGNQKNDRAGKRVARSIRKPQPCCLSEANKEPKSVEFLLQIGQRAVQRAVVGCVRVKRGPSCPVCQLWVGIHCFAAVHGSKGCKDGAGQQNEIWPRLNAWLPPHITAYYWASGHRSNCASSPPNTALFALLIVNALP